MFLLNGEKMKSELLIKRLLLVAAVVAVILIVKNIFLSNESIPSQQNQQPKQATPVTVAKVISGKLTEWDEFIGRIQAPQTVDLRPRVSGYINQVAFEEGSLVEAGQTLFLIDNRSFTAEVKRLKANLDDANSQKQLAKREYQRAQELVKKKAISTELLDERYARQQQTSALVQSVQAALELAQLNLSYTQVTAPITGRVSNALITKGNYVTAGDSILTTIVSVQDVYAYFDADEQTYLKYSQLAKQGSRPSSRDTKNPVYMGLASDSDFPYQGVIDFVDNRINESTGTIRGRALFNNPDGILIPGLFARIKLVGSASYEGILIDDKAIGTNLNHKFVLVLDNENKVQYRTVVLGEKVNGLRIIKSGLFADERIIVKGLQRVRPGSLVAPEEIPMADESILKSLQSQQKRLDDVMAKDKIKEQIVHSRLSDAIISLQNKTNVIGG
jgi:multidrug efflux system membrane fusion protein